MTQRRSPVSYKTQPFARLAQKNAAWCIVQKNNAKYIFKLFSITSKKRASFDIY